VKQGRTWQIFEWVPLGRLTGNRLFELNQAHVVLLEEVVHWSQLKIDFAIIGPPNSGTSTLQRTLQSHPHVHVLGGYDETNMPSGWLRAEESWSWRCTSPTLVLRRWAQSVGIGIQHTKSAKIKSVRRLTGLRNPKLIYSVNCLRHLTSIPGIRIIALVRNPIEWLWSSLLRVVEGFNVSGAELDRMWAELAIPNKPAATGVDGAQRYVDNKEPVVQMHREGGGLHELAGWRLGEPITREGCLLSARLRSLATQLSLVNGRLVVIHLKWLQRAWTAKRILPRLLLALGLSRRVVRRPWLGASRVLPLNVRRRQVRQQRLRMMFDPSTTASRASLEKFFAEEQRSMERILSEHGISPVH